MDTLTILTVMTQIERVVLHSNCSQTSQTGCHNESSACTFYEFKVSISPSFKTELGYHRVIFPPPTLQDLFQHALAIYLHLAYICSFWVSSTHVCLTFLKYAKHWLLPLFIHTVSAYLPPLYMHTPFVLSVASVTVELMPLDCAIFSVVKQSFKQ